MCIRDRFGLGQKEPQGAYAFLDMAAQDLEGIMMVGLEDALEVFGELGGGGGSRGHDGVSPTRQEAMA